MKWLAGMNANTQGIVCLVIALVFLTGSDAIIKWLSPVYALHEIMLFRALFALVVVAFLIRLEGGLHTIRTRRPLLHLFRGLLLVLANMFFFLGLAAMPFAENVALFFTAPLFICLLSQPVLGERVSRAQWAAIAVGLAGVIVMVRPGTDVFRAASLLPICAAFTYSVMQMVTRKLGMQERAGLLTLYIQVSFILVSVVSGLAIGDGRFNSGANPTLDFLLRAWQWPTAGDLQLLALCGVVVAFGGYFMSQAYRIAQASVVAPFEYTSMPLALLVGYLLWGDWPDWVSMAGSGLIIASGLLVLTFESRERRTRDRVAQKAY